MAKIKILNPSVGEDVEKLEFSHIGSRNIKWFSHHGKELRGSLKTQE
jgi:hypothetical protein